MWGDDGLPVVVTLIVYALAITRLTGLITTDYLTSGPRDRLVGWLDDTPGSFGALVAKLITCAWCASIWISAAAVPLIWFYGQTLWLLFPALVGAYSQAAGMLSDRSR